MNTTATLLPVPVPALEVAPMMPERVNALLRGVVGKIIGCRLFHHVHSLPVRSLAMGTFAAPDGAIPALDGANTEPIQAKSAFPDDELPIGHNRRTPEGAYAYTRELARRTIMAVQLDAGTIDAAIYIISRRYKLGTYLRKLWKGEVAVPRLDKVLRLEDAHRDAMRSVRDRF